MKCSYCKDVMILESSVKVYRGRDYGPMYICKNYPSCDSYVGVHKGTTRPLGTPANAMLRELRKEAHRLFDPFWKLSKNKQLDRKVAYSWLAIKLRIPKEECHIAMFTNERCKEVIKIIKTQKIGE